MSLWGNFGLMKPVYNFNDIFNKPDLQVEILLDEEELLMEFKQMNPKLLDLYFNNLKALANPVLVSPTIKRMRKD